MLFLALVLIITSAFLHAGWNVLAKVSKDTLAMMWWASLFGTFGYGLWLLSSSGIYINQASWIPFLISAAAETGYFVTLVRGYSKGDLSLVYPISRGFADLRSHLECTGLCRKASILRVSRCWPDCLWNFRCFNPN